MEVLNEFRRKSNRCLGGKKYTLTLEEAAEYFGISYKKLRLFCKAHADEEIPVVEWQIVPSSKENSSKST